MIDNLIKNVLVVLLVIFGVLDAFSQDIIVKESGEEIASDVVEITLDDKIKYTPYDQSDNSIKTLDSDDVFMIIYENGKREIFKDGDDEESMTEEVEQSRQTESESTSPEEKDEEESPVVEDKQPNQSEAKQDTASSQNDTSENDFSETESQETTDFNNSTDNQQSGYVSIGFGSGPIYGGSWGGKLTLRLGKGFALHGGMGYSKTIKRVTNSGLLYSVGMQIYPASDFYLHATYGTIARAGAEWSDSPLVADEDAQLSTNKVMAVSLWMGNGFKLTNSIVIDSSLGIMRDFKEYHTEDGNKNYENGALGGNWWWALNGGIEIRF